MSTLNSARQRTGSRNEDQELMEALGLRIEQIRTSLGLSQLELAQRIGVARTRIGRWERGEHVPPLGKLIALSVALETPLDSLIAGRPHTEPEPLSQKQRKEAAHHLNRLAGLLQLRPRKQ